MLNKEIIKVSVGGALGFTFGYILGDSVGAPLTGGAILGIAGAASSALRSYVNDVAKERGWEHSVTEAAKSAASLITKTVGRIFLIALHILYPGKAGGASIWTGASLIIGTAQIALSWVIHEMATQYDWNHSTVLLGECMLNVFSDAVSTITLIAVGILSTSGGGIVFAIGISALIFSSSLCNALLTKYNGTDISYRKFTGQLIN